MHSRESSVAVAAGVAAAAALMMMGAPAALSASRGLLCPTFCGVRGGPGVIGVHQLRGDRVKLGLVASWRGPLELVVARSAGGRLVHALPTVIDERPQEVLTGSFPVHSRTMVVAQIRLRRLRGGVGRRVVDLGGRNRSLSAGIYTLQVNAVTRSGRIRASGSSLIIRLERSGRVVTLLELHAAPGASTDRAVAVAQSKATVRGKVEPYGVPTTYYFQYRSSTGYRQRTANRRARSMRGSATISADLTGLSLKTRYRYRLVTSHCGGCRWGTSYGPDRTFTTKNAAGLSGPQLDADRAVATYNAMQQYLYAPNVYRGNDSSLYVESRPESGKRYSFLWPFSRALVGTITLAGIPASLLGGASYQGAVKDRLRGLSHYWDGRSARPGYDSYPLAPYGRGGDKYYDDAGWIGLALAQEYALTGDRRVLDRAERVLDFVYPGGWAGAASFEPGGVYWVRQGAGVGKTNHARTTNSTAPNAETALLLAHFAPTYAATYNAEAGNMYGWANRYLYNVRTSRTDGGAANPNFKARRPALMFDKIRGNHTTDHTLWTYNQGAMIAANVREYQRTGKPIYLSEAEAIATVALGTFTNSDYFHKQAAAFNAIFFRGLLVLCSVTTDAALKAEITETIQTYADDAWTYYRRSNGLFRFPHSSGSGYQLLDQGAMLQIYAMLAWNPADYGKLP